MKNFKFYVFIAAFLTLTIGSTIVVRQAFDMPLWQDVVYEMGGEFILPRSGMPCAYFGHDKQTICYRTTENWYGEDAVPAYVVEAGKCTPLYGPCPESF